jgi:hypothetical protein
MKKYQGFKYKIRIRLDGRYHFAVWWADANSRRDDPIWLKTVASKAVAERAVKRWIDDRHQNRRAQGVGDDRRALPATPWLRINRVMRVMLHTRWSGEAWAQVLVEFRKAVALRGQIRRAGWFN